MNDRALATCVQLPCEEAIVQLRKQYKRAVNGLYEAYLFGMMMLKVKVTLDKMRSLPEVFGDAHGGTARRIAENGEAMRPVPEGFPCDAHGGTARRIVGKNGNEMPCAAGWNAGLGLKGWLSRHCPEIHYSTARRFMEIAIKTTAALCPPGAAQPDTRTIRAYLAGKTQKELLRGGKREGAGRKPNDAELLATHPEATWKELEEPLQLLSEALLVHRRHQHLTPTDRQTLKDALTLMLETLSESSHI